MTVIKTQGGIVIAAWDNSCLAEGPTKIVYGPFDGLAQYEVAGAVCDIPADINVRIVADPTAGDLWFVVVKTNEWLVEGSWGQSTAGERNGGVASGECGGLVKITSGSCP